MSRLFPKRRGQDSESNNARFLPSYTLMPSYQYKNSHPDEDFQSSEYRSDKFYCSYSLLYYNKETFLAKIYILNRILYPGKLKDSVTQS